MMEIYLLTSFEAIVKKTVGLLVFVDTCISVVDEQHVDITPHC